MSNNKISSNPIVESYVQFCFGLIEPSDVSRFTARLKGFDPGGDEVMNCFRELVVQAYLSAAGLHVRYEMPIDGKTPDWSWRATDGSLAGIADMYNLGADSKLSELDKRARAEQQDEDGYFYARFSPSNTNRLYWALYSKASHSDYVGIATKYRVPYLVVAHIDFRLAIESSEIADSIQSDMGVFANRENVSGVLLVQDGYSFQFIPNPNAIRKIELPGARMSPERIWFT